MKEIICKMENGTEIVMFDSDTLGDVIRILREHDCSSMQMNIEDDGQDSSRIDIGLLEGDQR
jgi:hypothetical protein